MLLAAGLLQLYALPAYHIHSSNKFDCINSICMPKLPIPHLHGTKLLSQCYGVENCRVFPSTCCLMQYTSACTQQHVKMTLRCPVDIMTGAMFHTLQTSYLAVQYRLCLALVPGKAEALRQNLCSSTYPSLLSRKEYQSQCSLNTSSINQNIR